MHEKVKYEEDLKSKGLKTTKSRKAVINILLESEQPIAAEEIYLKLKERKVKINFSTVYRTLETLEGKGMVTKLNIMDSDRMLFEYNKMGHRHYLVCIDCKKIVTIENCPLESYEKDLENETNFTILGHKLYLYGYCLECKRNKVNE